MTDPLSAHVKGRRAGDIKSDRLPPQVRKTRTFFAGLEPEHTDATLAFMILLFTGMILGVDFLQIVDGHMGIDLGGFQGLMTEHFL